jgi:hypothetical protein
MRLVQIDWIDSKTAPNEWEYIEGIEALEPVVCSSVGFLIQETSAYKTIAHSMSDSQVCGRITIPTACIKKCRRLR